MPASTSLSAPYRLFAVVTCLALVLSVVAVLPPAVTAASGKIDPDLATRLAGEGQAPALVFLAEQADLSDAAHVPDKTAKTAYVYQAVREVATRSQAGLRTELDQRGVPYQAFYSVNMLYLPAANLELVDDLAARADVRLITLDAPFGVDKLESTVIPANGEAIASGVNYIRAPQVWALGIDGTGIVVAGADTGVRWTHEALKPQYRGWNGVTADHSISWHDAIHDGATNVCGFNATAPCDDHSHGSHTVGTVAGDDRNADPGQRDQVGVAPGSKWIACRNMNAGVGTISRYVECNDWFLAPGGNPANAPDVINNSWGCPSSEGCNTSTWMQIQPSIQALMAAGTMFVASAGNSGSGCNTILDPPAVYPESFAVGSFSDATGTIAGSSSRGQRAFTNLFGPDISAPGVGIRSAYKTNDTSYGTMSGTSMAGPHVVGLVALMWQANPQLRGHILETAQYIRETADRVDNTTCGVLNPYPDPLDNRPTPNQVYGWGRIDALDTVNAVLCPADIDYDGSVDVRDVQLVSEIWLTQPGDLLYNARRNLDFSDPAITAADITAVASAWGTTCG